jgi:hypothetical protein
MYQQHTFAMWCWRLPNLIKHTTNTPPLAHTHTDTGKLCTYRAADTHIDVVVADPCDGALRCVCLQRVTFIVVVVVAPGCRLVGHPVYVSVYMNACRYIYNYTRVYVYLVNSLRHHVCVFVYIQIKSMCVSMYLDTHMFMRMCLRALGLFAASRALYSLQ